MARLTRRQALIAAGSALAGLAGAQWTRPQTSRAAAAATFEFQLDPANTALSPNGGPSMCPEMDAPGCSIKLTGSGTFTPATGAVKASGRCTCYNPDGSVDCVCTWTATSLSGFTDYGADANGDEGGVISLVTTCHSKQDGTTTTGIPMTITSAINAPSGTVEGTTWGSCSQPTGGGVTIQQQ